MGILLDLARSAPQRTGEVQPEPMTRTEEAAIREWLARIDETDPAITAYLINSCRTDPGARAYFLRYANGEYLH